MAYLKRYTLEAALEDGDPRVVASALGDIARDTGLGCESLYKALSPDGNPELATLLKVVAALGLQLRAAPKISPSWSSACCR